MTASDFVPDFSIEATRPSASEITQLGEILASGTSVYVTAIPKAAPDETVGAAVALRRAGLEPVIHIAARRLPSADTLQDVLQRLTGEAGVQRLLVIGGDIDAAGPYADALAVIQKGDLRRHGIEEIGIGAYPEGHPRIPTARLEASLDEKIASATAQGLRVNIVTQFSFSGERIIAWLKQLRSSGIKNRVGIGLAGPTSVPALIRYAKRAACRLHCVDWRPNGDPWSAMSGGTHHRYVERITARRETRLHYSFGGVVQTARHA
jgi:methylenetetrahydrofolate reductase (NADPH)